MIWFGLEKGPSLIGKIYLEILLILGDAEEKTICACWRIIRRICVFARLSGFSFCWFDSTLIMSVICRSYSPGILSNITCLMCKSGYHGKHPSTWLCFVIVNFSAWSFVCIYPIFRAIFSSLFIPVLTEIIWNLVILFSPKGRPLLGNIWHEILLNLGAK